MNLGTVVTYINNQLSKLLAVEPVAPEISYKVYIHDDANSNIQTYRFNTLKEAMDWVNDMDLMYTTEKKVFLEHVKADQNSLIELNIYTKNVYEKRSTVYRN